MLEWWKIAALTKFEFLLKIAGEIVVARKLDRGTKRRVSLYKNFTGRFSSSGASGDLCEKLNSDTGVHLAAGPSVADEKVTLATIDNFSFDAASAPEPTSLGLLTASFVRSSTSPTTTKVHVQKQ